jgi:hypothetical protein
MGLSICSSCDLENELFIGFLQGGSNGQESEYYESQLVTYLQKNMHIRKQLVKSKKQITDKNIWYKDIEKFNIDLNDGINSISKYSINF